MRAIVLARGPRDGHQHSWGNAFCEGLRRHSWEAKIEIAPSEPCDLLILWGVRRRLEMQRQLAAGGQVCVLERGYLGDRFRWTSVSFGGGLNGRAEFRGTSADPARFNKHFALEPWKDPGGYALIMGQVKGDMSLVSVGGSLKNWYRDTATKLRRLGHQVRFRPHPMDRLGHSAPADVQAIGGGLASALAGAEIVVTFNSNSAVDAIIAGVPAMAADGGSMAWAVTTHRPDQDPIRPDRTEWAARLAWCQWTHEEIASGECWARIGA